MLICPRNFIEFIKQALSLANKCTFKDYLFDSINKASYCKYSNIENEYLSYYAALENLVNGFKNERNLHFILDQNSWKGFNKNLKKFVKQHALFQQEKNKRQLIYEKLPELNRISFSSAFNLFCQCYEIDLSDLWSISGGYEYSLTKIRNLLIHGGRFEREKFNLLFYAKCHLKWTLERCILRILNWNIERSNVSASFLIKFKAYNEWQKIRNSL